MIGAVGFAVLALTQLPKEPSDPTIAAYAGIGIAAGLIGSYGAMFCWNAAWAAARQRNEAWAWEDAQAPATFTDEEVIASLSDESRRFILSEDGNQAIGGNLFASHVPMKVKGELQECSLANITHGTPGLPGRFATVLSNAPIAYLQLNPDGQRIFRKIREG